MISRIVFLLIFLFSFLVFPTEIPFAASAEAPASLEVIEGNIDDVAKTIQTYFPKVTGKVLSVDGEMVEVDLGREKGISEGVLLTVFRERDPFRHPVTGVTLGKFEEQVGTIEVTGVGPARSSARGVKPSKPIRVGDSVRIPATRIPLAISLASPESQTFLMNELISALADTGRFRIDRLPPQSSADEALKKNNLYFIQLATARSDEKFLMNLQLQNAETGATLSKVRVRINQSEESDLILEHLQYQLFEQQQKRKEE